MNFAQDTAPLPTLAPGAYSLYVEAARESGRREVLALPFQWPPPPRLPKSASKAPLSWARSRSTSQTLISGLVPLIAYQPCPSTVISARLCIAFARA